MTARLTARVRGIVQGIGFRPFVLRQARALGLSGTVGNTAEGVRIVCEGPRERCEELLTRVRQAPPPGALVFSLELSEEPPRGESSFRILPSESGPAEAAVSPDLGVCEDCARELFDPSDRRYRYPFLNCTACGPRLTILRAVPSDRQNTTMSGFAMCADCAREYADPENRRFHAQPTACPQCGPRLQWQENGCELPGDAIARFESAIRAGEAIAVKGLGGYHLACDATNADAVARVRERKRRYAKPRAVMARDIEAAEALCEISPEERAELLSPRKPIVLLKKREDSSIAEGVAPGNRRLGVMLPYAPLHLLLTRNAPPLVLTSANVSDAPMPYRAEDEPRVAALCDALLTHDRPILRRMDDSVCVFAGGARRLTRRARGFVPEPIALPGAKMQVMAFGAQLKNAFCLAKDGRAYLSGHIGDLDDAETYAFYVRELESFRRLFGGAPDALARDLHPDYASTRVAAMWAERFPEARVIAVQHHHAHFASVLAEHGLTHAQGFVWDGSGYGTDGTLWGGEQLIGTAARAERAAGLTPLRLIGGDAAVREPWRVALYALNEACGADTAIRFFGHRPEAEALLRTAGSDARAPRSSGMGRLFDAIAAIAGLCPVSQYEGQAAITLEQALDESAKGRYAFAIGPKGWDWRPVVREAARDAQRGADAGAISARFHRALTALVAEAALPGEPVVLSGGVFQNVHLMEECLHVLRQKGYDGFANERVPSGDGGVGYGQAAVAAARMNGGDRYVSGDSGDDSGD